MAWSSSTRRRSMSTSREVASSVQVPRRFERWRAAQAREALCKHKESGLSLAAFARRQGLPLHRLQWWRARLKEVSKEQRSPVRLVPVRIRSTATLQPSANGFEIGLCGGRIIRVAAPFDADALVQLVRALEEIGC